MAERPVFIPITDQAIGTVRATTVEFKWSPGFAAVQKQRSIRSFHEAVRLAAIAERPLEVSSKSEEPVGRALSAFALAVALPGVAAAPVECVFQGSKVFERGGPFVDLYEQEPRAAKRDARLVSSGPLVGFQLGDEVWPLTPQTALYDWLYLLALTQHVDLAAPLLGYDAFTDIEFNPRRSLNCQASAAALYVAMNATEGVAAGMKRLRVQAAAVGKSLS